jgi:hypothetical protein
MTGMETPPTKAGEVTEKIMSIFWQSNTLANRLDTDEYNQIWSHVLRTLQREYPS